MSKCLYCKRLYHDHGKFKESNRFCKEDHYETMRHLESQRRQFEIICSYLPRPARESLYAIIDDIDMEGFLQSEIEQWADDIENGVRYKYETI